MNHPTGATRHGATIRGIIVHDAPPDGPGPGRGQPDAGPSGQETRAVSLEAQRFEDLVARYRKPLTAAAVHLCGEREAAQDAVQETFLAAYQGLSRLRDPERLGAWLFAVLRRKSASLRRSRRPETPLSPDLAELPAPQAEGDALVSAVVREQLAHLSREDREILSGKYLLGLSYQELGEAMGLREGAVRVRCFRAKERMREMLQGAGVYDAGKHDAGRHDAGKRDAGKRDGGKR